MTFDADLFNERMNDLTDGTKFMLYARTDENKPAYFMAAFIKQESHYSVVGPCWSVQFDDWTGITSDGKIRFYQRYMGVGMDDQPEVQFTNVFTLLTNNKDIWEIGGIRVRE